MKKLLPILFFMLLFSFSSESQNICNKNILVWDFQIGSGNKKLANKVAKEVERAIVNTNKPTVLERDRYNEVVKILQNEDNLCFCPNDLTKNTVAQLKKYSANEVVFGRIGKDVYYDAIFLELTITNIYNLSNDRAEKITFKQEVFDNPQKREIEISKAIERMFTCDKISEDIEKVVKELNDTQMELERLEYDLEKQYEARLQLDNYLLADKRIRKDHPQLEKLHKSVTNLRTEKAESIKIIQEKEREHEYLLAEQKKQRDGTLSDPIPDGFTGKGGGVKKSCEKELSAKCLNGRNYYMVCVAEFDKKYKDKFFVQVASYGSNFTACFLERMPHVNGNIYVVDNGNPRNPKAKYAVRIGPFENKKSADNEKNSIRRSYVRDAVIFCNGKNL